MNCDHCQSSLVLEVETTPDGEQDCWRYVCTVCRKVGNYALTPAQAEAVFKHPEYAVPEEPNEDQETQATL